MGERYDEIKRIFLLACTLEGDARRELLDRECGDDRDLRSQVEALLTRDVPSEGVTVPMAGRGPGGAAAGGVAVPEHVGRCRVLHEIGRGGMGVVYLGVLEDGRFRRRVAIKLLKKGMDTEDVLRRFELERQVLAALNHANIGRLFDAGETEDGRPYFVMEYVEGQPIDDYCDTERLTVPERLKLFSAVCAAVHSAHQNLVVHRDLKPSNIIVTKEGDPKLLDFGIAKIINPDLSPHAGDPTGPAGRFMTPEYASPEQVRGTPISTASDIYSLGVLLYELLSGHRPYRLRSRVQQELERVICEEDPERPSTAAAMVEEIERPAPAGKPTTITITPEAVCRDRGDTRPERLRRRLSGDLDNIVLKAMRKEPHRRYASAEQLAEDIRRHLASEPVIARPPSARYRASRFVRRHRAGVAVAALVVVSLTLAALTTIASQSARAAESERAAVAARAAEAEAREIAERERAAAEAARADLREAEVRQLVDTLLTDLHDAVQALPNAVEARELIIETARTHLERLAERPDRDADLALALARAYDRLGAVRFGVRNPSRGHVPAARDWYERSIGLADAVLADDADSVHARRRRIISQIHLADVHRVTGDLEAAAALVHEALAAAQQLADRHPDDSDIRRELSVVLLGVGAVAATAGDHDEARARYAESLEMRRALVLEKPRDPQALRDLSVALIRTGRALGRDDEHQAAVELLLEAVEIRRDLARRLPDTNRYERDLAVANRYLADAYDALGEVDAAAACLQAAVDAMERLVEASPGDYRARRDLVMALQRLGDFAADHGRHAEALVVYERYRGQATPLFRVYPWSVEAGRLAAAGHQRVADGLARAGRIDDALDGLRRAESILEDLLAAHPEDARVRRDLELTREARDGLEVDGPSS
ncbi:MAG: serine/threonine-protein kinase [Planctomycetota bacterium]